MKGLWGRYLGFFLALVVGNSLADKEFWWMGQEGTFGQGSSQVRDCESTIFCQTVHDAITFRVKQSSRGLEHHPVTRVDKVGSSSI